MLDLLEVITIGFPFCGFKILSGLVLRATSENTVIQILSISLIALGLVDILINFVNLLGLIFRKKFLLPACFFEILLRPDWTWHDLGKSVDVLLSFCLVALVIGRGLLHQMTPEQLNAWDICVIFNVIGAGLSRFGHSLSQRRS